MTKHSQIVDKNLRLCRLCGGNAQFFCSVNDENHRTTDVRFNYFKCSECQGIWLDNIPSDLKHYYLNEYYAIPSLERLQKLADKDRNKIDTILRFATSGRLLEIGPAFGVFAWQAKQAGFEVDVIEMDNRCCDYLRHTLNVNVIQSDSPIEDMKFLAQYDVIAIWHVLEHLDDPCAFLDTAAKNLMPGGILAIAMPNPGAWQFRIMGGRWPHLDAPRHVTLIAQEWLALRAEAVGLEKVYLTSDDSDARSWNIFGWQRLLMNRFRSKFIQRVMFFIGYGLSLVMALFDRKNFNGSAYTVVFRKK